MCEYYSFDGHHYHRQKARVALLDLLKHPTFGCAWLINDGTVVAGYIVLCYGYSLEYLGRDAFIDEFYLRESYRGIGWGRAAFEFAREQARRENVQAIHLEVVKSNTGALGFYRKLGFKDHDHHLMTLPLTR